MRPLTTYRYLPHVDISTLGNKRIDTISPKTGTRVVGPKFAMLPENIGNLFINYNTI